MAIFAAIAWNNPPNARSSLAEKVLSTCGYAAIKSAVSCVPTNADKRSGECLRDSHSAELRRTDPEALAQALQQRLSFEQQFY